MSLLAIIGKVSPVTISCISAVVVKYFVLPYQESHYIPFFEAIIPSSFLPYYDVRRDTTATLMMVSAIFGYIVMSGICSFMDCWSPSEWKTQGEKSYMNLVSWLRVVSVSLFNMFVFSWIVVIPVWAYIHKGGIFRSAENQALAILDEVEGGYIFDPTIFLINFLLHSVIIDAWFYSTHIILHWPPLYKSIHKWHHTYHAPTAVCCMYANPLEFAFGNVLGVILGPALTNCHPYECAFWMCFALSSTSGSHSGYKFLGALDHDRHHEHLHCNYGVGVFMDSVFSTKYEGSELERKVNKKLT